ncbi:hypothetical protein [Phycicoccus sp.]|uniref:hypothetical protein n=1 Tax=Phycicoccus sp. TaxID=1902410 RepID=UPI002B6314FA|nr:hypothetical protein [Phycicoccus sp.]HMM94658.1 hypothetical protein [Phycicoccus sp.]
MPPAPLTRRALVLGGGGRVLAGGAVGGVALDRARRAEVPLYSETVAFAATGERELVPAGRADLLVPGTRVLAARPGTARLVEDERAWLEGCARWAAPGAAGSDDLLHSALLDLRALTDGLPVSVAGWSPRWRYAWPRDVAFVASALARLGRPAEAATQLGWLQEVQRDDGWFEARYEPTTGHRPDDRPPQLDGCGWVLWATDELATHAPERAAELVAPLRGLLVRSTNLLLTVRDPATGLPPPSSDYWELVEDQLTLGTAAVVLAGLRCAARVLPLVGELALADRAEDAAHRLASPLHDAFGREGYPRHVGGLPDAAVTFLVAPIGAATPEMAVLQAIDRAQTAMARPAGGLAPGAAWKQDGISWTPETALFASAWASTGHRGKAHPLLDWLGRHRTTAGAFPEKVLHDGRPAAVAPLAWTAALVVIARHELARG